MIESQHQGIIAGIDEVGRGPWAGPVVACSLIFLTPKMPKQLSGILDDSKAMTELRRQEAYEHLVNTPHLCHWAIGEACVSEIDKLNIYHATLLAMQRSFETLQIKADVALIDGNASPKLPCQTIPIIKGDSKSLTIAAASVVAKVHRDRYMRKLSEEYPQYQWHTNMGYGTKAHQDALKQHGPTRHHRQSFAPIKELFLAA